MPEVLATTGSRYSKDVTGLRKIDLVFVIAGPAEHGGAEPYDELEGYQPTAPLGLTETNRHGEKQEDGAWQLVITFEGIVGNAPGDIVAELDYASVEDPIETFEKFDALITKYQSKDKFDDETGKFEGFKRMIPMGASGIKQQSELYGVKAFFNDNPILRLSFVLGDFRKDLLKNICKIDTPLYPEGQQDIIETQDGKTWLKRTVKAQYRGNAWRYQMEWLLGKWVPDIYNPTA